MGSEALLELPVLMASLGLKESKVLLVLQASQAPRAYQVKEEVEGLQVQLV